MKRKKIFLMYPETGWVVGELEEIVGELLKALSVQIEIPTQKNLGKGKIQKSSML